MASDEKPARPARAKVRWSDRPKLAPDAAGRQGLVTRLALEAFGSRDKAIAYLNTAAAISADDRLISPWNPRRAWAGWSAPLRTLGLHADPRGIRYRFHL